VALRRAAPLAVEANVSVKRDGARVVVNGAYPPYPGMNIRAESSRATIDHL